jgi:hypothetical protein
MMKRLLAGKKENRSYGNPQLFRRLRQDVHLSQGVQSHGEQKRDSSL